MFILCLHSQVFHQTNVNHMLPYSSGYTMLLPHAKFSRMKRIFFNNFPYVLYTLNETSISTRKMLLAIDALNPLKCICNAPFLL